MWVTLQCLSRPDLLTRMAKHTSSEWVPQLPLQCCEDQDYSEELQIVLLCVPDFQFLSVYCLLTFFQAHSLANFLNPYFESNDSDSGLSSIISSITSFFQYEVGRQKSSLIYFTGLLNVFSPVCILPYDDNRTTHLHGEHLLDHQQRWRLCGVV